MLDRAIFAGGVHRLKDEQHGPTVLRVKDVLQFCESLSASGERLFGALLVLCLQIKGFPGVNVLESKAPAICYSVRVSEPLRFFDYLFGLHLLPFLSFTIAIRR